MIDKRKIKIYSILLFPSLLYLITRNMRSISYGLMSKELNPFTIYSGMASPESLSSKIRNIV
jgi:hypothetical protein